MDNNVKLSFIPKKPLTRQDSSTRRPMSLFVALSSSVFIITIAIYGGMYFYISTLNDEINDKKITLEKTKDNFDLTIIEKAKKLRTQIISAEQLIDNHIAVTTIVDFLGKSTLKSIWYGSFQYEHKDGVASILLQGKAPNFASLALQRDSLLREEEKKNIYDFSMGDYTLDVNGNVSFEWRARLNKALFTYRSSGLSLLGATPVVFFSKSGESINIMQN